MKYLILLFLLFTYNTIACIGEPTQLEVNPENGFVFEEAIDHACDSCKSIFIQAPKIYLGHKFSAGIFTVTLNESVVSKSVHSYYNESGVPEFRGYISSKSGFNYTVTFLYGEDRCKNYEFKASSQPNKS